MYLGQNARRARYLFMAITSRVLLAEQHSFMHGLESFFWLLFWTPGRQLSPEYSILEEKSEESSNVSDNIAYIC